MKHKFVSGAKNLPGRFPQLILIIGAISGVLASPKWSLAIFAWIAPACFLFYFRLTPIKRKFLWALIAFIIMNIAASYEVAPFPIAALVILALIESLKTLLLYVVNEWSSTKYRNFKGTLFFPAAAVSLEYFNSLTGGGVWWSIANSQFNFHCLTQLSLITGLWGISFLIYWFASVLVWAFQNRAEKNLIKKASLIYGSILLGTLIF